MKKRNIIWMLFILFAGFFSCDKDEYELGDDDIPNTETNDKDKNEDFSTNPKDTVFANAVVITYASGGVTVNNPYESKGVSITVNGGNVLVKSTLSGTAISYVLTGAHTDGSFKIYSDYTFGIGLNGVNLLCSDGPAVNIQSKQEATVVLVGGTNNRMIDNNIYSEDSEDRKATLFSEGGLHFQGSGKLVLKGYCKHAVCSDEYITVSGGDIEIQSAYKDGFHANDLISVTGGVLSIVSTDDGMECEDGDVEILGGNITIQTIGDAYYNAEKTDVSSSAGIKSSGNFEMKKGSLNITSTGSAGKGISVDGTMTVGVSGANDNDLLITAGTTGAKVLVSGSTGGGRPGGGGMNADYANPKIIKSEGNLTINSGTLLLTGTTDGGEGLESKATLTINGGYMEIRTYDDCINAATHIQINGGTIYACATGNDAIDSNGDITIAGGLIVAQGSEDGLDSDNTAIQITGGTVIGMSGQTMSRFTGTQKYISANVAAGSEIGVKMGDEWALLFRLPAAATGSGGQPGGNRGAFTVFISLPQFVNGAGGTLYSGGSISGGSTTAFGYNTGGTYSGGTSQAFTVK